MVDAHQDLIQKYKERIEKEFGQASPTETKVSSREYTEFKQELYPTHFSLYEKACNFSENLLKLKVDGKSAAKYQKFIDLCHLNVTPSGVVSLSIILPLTIMIVGALVSFAIFQLLFFVVFFLFAGLLMIPALQKTPEFMANSWRMKASNQMVQSIFYLVTYMRHTSNLERAIQFAADHLETPLNLDFRKILWDVETQKFSTIRDAANAYLEKWSEWEKDFVESFHLVESSLFESVEERRLALLDKSLDVILNGTYENMLHYAHGLKAPMTMLHMLGIILPILGLVILPLVVSFLGSGDPFTTTIYISMLYNVSLPVGVYYLGRTILSKRPGGYGAADISKKAGVKEARNVAIPLSKAFVIRVNPLYFSIMIVIVTIIIGLSPLLFHTFDPNFDIPFGENAAFLDYICPPCAEGAAAGTCGEGCSPDSQVGPYGIGASMLSLLLIAGIGASIGVYYRLRSKNVVKIRNRTKELEDEFSSALFQLGNRLGDGLPAEIAFSKVAATMRGSTSGDFFNVAEKNITKLGMGLEQSLFDPKVGAVRSFPSKVIES
ncbi:hypothetical protein CL620_01700, partial [archaeon]|nr:hypothetical protein [archaeon]